MKTCEYCKHYSSYHPSYGYCNAIQILNVKVEVPCFGGEQCPSFAPAPRTCSQCRHFSPPVADLAHCKCPTPMWDHYQPNENEQHVIRHVTSTSDATNCECFRK